MKKKLYRSPKDGILLGIASGLGHYFDKDPVIVRLIIVIAALLTKVWPIAVLYAIMFLIIPVDPAQAKVSSDQEPKDVTSSSPDEKNEEPQAQKEGTENTEPVERMDSGQNM